MRADLKVGSQCAEACMKANRMLGLIKRTFVVRSTAVLWIGFCLTGPISLC